MRLLAATPRPRADARAPGPSALGGFDLAVWAVAALVAICTAVSLPANVAGIGLGAYGWRAGSAILAIAMLACSGFRLSAAAPLFGVFAPWMAAMTALAAIRLGDLQAWLEWLRHAYMILVGACVFAGCQTQLGRLLVGRTTLLLLVCLLLLSVQPAATLLAGGWSWEEARLFKAQKSGLSLNSFMYLFALLISALWIQVGPRLTWFVAAAAFVAASLLFASRAPVVSVCLAAVLVGGFSLWRGGRRMSGVEAAVLTAAVLLVPLGFVVLVVATPDSPLGQTLAGRAQLWQISLAVWAKHPLIGAGTDALAYGVRSQLNAGAFFADWQRESLFTLANGGFHNIWLETLASKGLVGLMGLLGSYFLLLRLGLASAAAGRSRALLFFTLLLFSRGYVEVSGLFSYENSPHDFLAFTLVAWSLAAALGPSPAEDPSPGRLARARPSRRGLQMARRAR